MTAEYAFDASAVTELTLEGGAHFSENARPYARPVPGLAGTITVRSTRGTTIRIHTLTHGQALQCWKLPLWGQDHVVISDATLVPHDHGLEVSFMEQPTVSLWVYPAHRHCSARVTGK